MRAAVLREKGIRLLGGGDIRTGRFAVPEMNPESGKYETIETIIPAPPSSVRSFIPCEVMAGVLRRLDTGAQDTRFMGYRNRGGTLDVLVYSSLNQQTKGRISSKKAVMCWQRPHWTVLTMDEMGAIAGKRTKSECVEE